MIADELFSPAFGDGISIQRDRVAQSYIVQKVRENLATLREWFEPGTRTIADHISDDFVCSQKVLRRKEETQKKADAGIGFDSADDEAVIRFAKGYAFQFSMLGVTEQNMWSEEDKLWYSIDGKVDHLYVEAKQTARSAIRKADREEGLSVESVLLRDNPRWWQHMMAVMHYTGRREHWLIVDYGFGGGMETFHIQISDEAVEKNWEQLTLRREERRKYERLGTYPGIFGRTVEDECDWFGGCEFRLECHGS